MQISALGPLAIDGKAVEGTRLPALLLPLLLARGRIVPAGDLVEAVWDGAPPADPAGALQALVTRARRLGLTVTATAGGYRLDPEPLTVDVLVAQDLLGGARAASSAGDQARATELATEGLELWSADDDAPAAGLAGRVFTDLLTLRVEGELATRDGVGVRSDLPGDGLLDLVRDAVGHRPADEPLTALLMRALAARGRDAEAHAVYERLRETLAQTYGTDPSAVVAQTHLALLRGELLRDAVLHDAVLRGDRSDTPPVREAERPWPVAELPRWRRPTTSILGRDADVAALERELAAHALVTVVAVGGAGKTRLAVEVARRATDRGEAVYAVELAGIREPAEVLPALLSALGAAESASDTDDVRTRRVLGPQERMRRAVAALDGLLVLDNCEHLLAAAADVAAQVIGSAGPGLRILATSRAPLAVVGEVVHPVDTLPDEAALAVLETRGRAVRPALEWDRAAALELCHRLDNLPLALELAAARLRSMPLADVLAGVSHRFALLDDALRGLPDRHRGLWAMVDWSWALLDAPCRALLRDLAVVPAPFTAATAAAVSGRPDPAEAANGLALLVEQSLLVLEEHGPDRPARYRMLETVREYGEARLEADSARDAAMDRLVCWAAREAYLLRGHYVGPDQIASLDATADDQDTFVTALRWAIDHFRDRQAYAIAAALFTFWTIRGLHVEASTWAHQLLRADSPNDRRDLWRLLGTARGRANRAAPHPDDALVAAGNGLLNSSITMDLRVGALGRRIVHWALATGGAQVSARSAALGQLALVPARTDHLGQLAVSSQLVGNPDPYLHGLGLFLRAALRENHGDVLDSVADARAAYAFFEAIGDHWGMGMTAQAVGQWEAGRTSEQSDEWLTRAVDNLQLVGAVQDARTLLVIRDLRRALAGSSEAVAGLEQVVASPSASASERAHALIGLGMLAAQEGRLDESVERADAAVVATRSEHAAVPQARIVTEIAAAVLRIRAGRDGVALLDVAAHTAFTVPDMPVLGTVALGYAELATARGETERAAELWAIGIRLGANLSALLGGSAAPSPEQPATGPSREVMLRNARELTLDEAIARLAALVRPGG